MFGEFLSIIVRSIKLDKTFYGHNGKSSDCFSIQNLDSDTLLLYNKYNDKDNDNDKI